MFKQGIKSLTMDNIAQMLCISKKTIYQYVENKAELVAKVIDLTLSEQHIAFEDLMKEDGNPIDQLLKMYVQNTKMMQEINPALIVEMTKYFPDGWNKLLNFRNEFIFDAVRSNLEHGIKSGLYRPDINIDIIAKIYTMRALGMFNYDIFPPDVYPGELVFKQMFMHHVRGICSKNGIEYLEQEFSLLS